MGERGQRECKAIYTPFEVKSVDEEARTFRGLASTYSVDLDGERIAKGAFKRTIQHWKDSKGKRNIPLIDQHNYRSALDVVGKATDLKETSEGLDAEFQIVDSPGADEYLSRIKGGFLNGLSIGFEVVSESMEDAKAGGPRIRVIKELKLHEVSLVIWGANPEAVIQTAKQMATTKEGREVVAKMAREINAVVGDAGGAPRAGSLAALLNNLIDDSDDDRSVVVAKMARAAGTSPSTVQRILDADLICPPRKRLEGFAAVLGAPVNDLIAAARSDGGDYTPDQPGHVAVPRGKRLATMLNALVDERSVDDDRKPVIRAMARSARITEQAVNQILDADVICPPRDRLEAFADVLNVPASRLIGAAKSDGGDYTPDRTEMSRAEREIMDTECELIDVRRKKRDAIDMEDYEAAQILKQQEQGLEARLNRKKRHLERSTPNVSDWTPDDPDRLRLEALVTGFRATAQRL